MDKHLKKILCIVSFLSVFQTAFSQKFEFKNGHPEHLVLGFAIGRGASYLTYKKTNNKFTSWLVGTVTSSAIGFAKEAIDPYIGRTRSKEDFVYTAIGGFIGASLVFPLRKKQVRKTPNITAAFKENSLDTLSLSGY